MGSAEGLGKERKRLEKRGPGQSMEDVLMRGKRQLWPPESRVVRTAKGIVNRVEYLEFLERRYDRLQGSIRDYFAVRDYLGKRGRVKAKSD